MRLLRERARKKDALALAAGELLDRPPRQREQIEAFQRRVRDFEVVPGLEVKRSQMRRAAHQHDFEHRELKRDGIFLRDRRQPPCERAAIVLIERTAVIPRCRARAAALRRGP